jgi:hypothetical protein
MMGYNKMNNLFYLTKRKKSIVTIKQIYKINELKKITQEWNSVP